MRGPGRGRPEVWLERGGSTAAAGMAYPLSGAQLGVVRPAAAGQGLHVDHFTDVDWQPQRRSGLAAAEWVATPDPA